MITGVYQIKNVITNDIYVGSCSHKNGFKLRWSNHIRSLKKGTHHSIILQRAWNKYGEQNFKFEILEQCESEKCIELEQYYFDALSPKYNVLKVAGSSLGRKLTLEHIEKLKNRSYDWMKGDNNWNKSDDKREFYRQKLLNNPIYINEIGREKISNYHKGVPKTDIQKMRMSLSKLGVPKSKEHIEKIKISKKIWAEENMRGNKNYFYGKKFIGEYNPNFSGYFRFKNKLTNEEIICSQTEFKIKYNFDSGKVSALCLGKRKSHHKWICLGKV